MAAGLEQALRYLENLRFNDDELQWIRGHGAFSPEFVRQLETFRFFGDVHAMPEGTIFFPGSAGDRPDRPGAIVESRLINLLHFETLDEVSHEI